MCSRKYGASIIPGPSVQREIGCYRDPHPVAYGVVRRRRSNDGQALTGFRDRLAEDDDDYRRTSISHYVLGTRPLGTASCSSCGLPTESLGEAVRNTRGGVWNLTTSLCSW